MENREDSINCNILLMRDSPESMRSVAILGLRPNAQDRTERPEECDRNLCLMDNLQRRFDQIPSPTVNGVSRVVERGRFRRNCVRECGHPDRE